MARAIWSGAISFGLVNIPVELMSAREDKPISFHMIDTTNNSPIGYKKVNKVTGKEVSPKKIAKGYEYERDQYVILKDEDFKKANPKATQTIDIEDFVEIENVDLLMFEKPYYLVPGKNGSKGYVLLRKVLEETGKAAIAQLVMRSKQHLVAIMARENYLILEMLRYAHEVREIEEAEFLDEKELAKVKISARELQMAEELVKGMTSDWKPEKYKDTYKDDLMKLIQQKVKKGDVEEVAEVDADYEKSSGTNVLSLMPLLEKSLEATRGKPAKTRARKKATRSSKSTRTRKAE